MTDVNAIRKYHERVDERLAARGVKFDGNRWQESDHPRDKDGKFASGGSSEGSKTKKVVKETSNVSNEATPKIKCDGPKGTRGYAKKYFAEHPEVKSEAKKYKSVLDKVRNFREQNPGAVDGTYSATTGKMVDMSDGFCVTFHQNLKEDDPFGGYDDNDYADMCAIAKNELGADDVNIGYFGNPEVSFHCKDAKKAQEFAIEHNQHSVYNVAEDSLWINPYYNRKTNPIEGK